MSHFTTVETQFKDLDALARALEKLGFVCETRKYNLLKIKNYAGGDDPQLCALRARRKTPDHQLSGHSELGFFWDKNKKLAIRADHMDMGMSQSKYNGPYDKFVKESAKPWFNGLKKAYAYEEVMASIRAKGYITESEKTDAKGHIHIHVRRTDA